MPVILLEQDEEDWLNPRLALDAAQALLVPFPADLLIMYEVSPKVNSPAFNIQRGITTGSVGVAHTESSTWII